VKGAFKTRRGSWLCPSEFDRARVVSASPRVRTLRLVSLGTLGAALLIAIPWKGWLYVALLVPVALTFLAVDLMIDKTPYPERVSVGAILITLLVLAVGVAIDGGSTSPALPWLVLPVAAIAARFRPQVVIAGVVLTAIVILAVTFGAHPARAIHEPVPVIATLALLISMIAIVWAIEAAELYHREAAVLDPLTGLLNRSSLLPRFREISEQARLTRRPVSLLMCDIDTFKAINDTYGHDRGDAVLRDVAYQMRRQLRSFELIYRLGGEEFLVLLPGVGDERAKEIAERLRVAVQDMASDGVPITISVGVSAGSGDAVEFDRLFKAADMALYDAKRTGRNRVIVSLPAGELAERRVADAETSEGGHDRLWSPAGP
jgi:diguanylate cyclase (GGDEF)-like protein